MENSSKREPAKKLAQKVIFIRVDDELYGKLNAVADEQDRTVNSLSIHLLRKGLEQIKREA